MNWPAHGSNPQYLYRKAGIPVPDELLDFSANINPLGPPRRLKEKWNEFFDEIIDYPDPHCSSLREQVAEREGLSWDSVLIGNGGAEIIFLIGKLLADKTVLIIEPAFSEYERACRLNGCRVLYYQVQAPFWQPCEDELAAALKEADAVFLCNPNNPTGVVCPREFIISFVERCRKNGTLLIIDEAFYDFLAEYRPLVPLLHEYENLIIIRSMTKMFAVPGLRLGYCLAAPGIVREMEKHQPPWSVNAAAARAGEVCLEEREFVRSTVDYISRERKKMFAFFDKEGFEYSPSEANFYLLRDPDVDNQYSLFEFLLQQGIVPRHTFNFPGLEGRWLRFAVKNEAANDRLMEVLSIWKARH